MFRRLIVLSALLSPLVLVAATPPAAAAAGSPLGSAERPAATTMAAAQPTLRFGARGGAVVTLQHRLAALHYFDVGPADGAFGQNTYHAVVAFQKVQGLTRDGVAGPATWAKLARPYVPAGVATGWPPRRWR